MKRKAKLHLPIDPGTPAGTTFDPGDTAFLFMPGDREHLYAVTVLTTYQLVTYTDHDDRLRRNWGYLVRIGKALDATFCFPWMLREYRDKPFHIRRVK